MNFPEKCLSVPHLRRFHRTRLINTNLGGNQSTMKELFRKQDITRVSYYKDLKTTHTFSGSGKVISDWFA
jgi:hypothetical protein